MQQTQDRREDELSTRRLRLISDIMEDYQENMRRTLRLLEMEMALHSSNHAEDATNRANERVHNTSEWTRGRSRMWQRDDPPINATRPRNDPPVRNIFQSNWPYTTQFRYFDFQDLESFLGYTTDEISQFTETITVTESMADLQCPITWEPFQVGQEVVRLRGCGHMFCTAAIHEWFRRSRRCPVCRADPLRANTTLNSNTSASAMPPPRPTNNTFSLASILIDSSGVAFQPIHRTQETAANQTQSQTQSQTENTNANANTNTTLMNSLLNGILGTLTDAVAENTDGDLFEREFTFDLNDLLRSQLRSRQRE